MAVFHAITCAKASSVKALAYAMLEAAAPKTGAGENIPLHMRASCSQNGFNFLSFVVQEITEVSNLHSKQSRHVLVYVVVGRFLGQHTNETLRARPYRPKSEYHGISCRAIRPDGVV